MSSTKHPQAVPRHKPIPRTAGNGLPGNRPPGAPQAAVSALMAFFVVEGFTLIELYGCLANVLGFDFSSGYLLVEIMVGATLMLITVIGMSRGKLWAVKLFRGITHAAAALYPAILAYAIYLDSGKTPIDPAGAWITFALSILQIPAFFVIYRAFKRVRWLDPKSLPQEWEPPARQIDPRYSDEPPKRGVLGWLITWALILAITLRYYIGIFRMDWFSAWLSSGDIWKELGTVAVLLVPILVVAGCFMTRRAAFWHRRIGG